MLGDISGLEKIYIVCGYTDMRKSIDGLCAVIEDQLKLEPSSINDCLSQAAINGQGSSQKSEIFPGGSLTG